MLKKISFIFLFLLCGCTNLSRQEEINIRYLQSQGVTIEKPAGSFVRPANPVAAGALNILPGGRKFLFGYGKRSRQFSLALWRVKSYYLAAFRSLGCA